MSLKSDFETIANSQSWGFEYGRADFNNLIDDVEENKTYIVMDPVKVKPLYNNVGTTFGYRYSGYFMMLRKSTLDNIYSGNSTAKYEKHIEPIYDDVETLKNGLTGCNANYDIEWECTEIVNTFNENMDGLIVKYTISI